VQFSVLWIGFKLPVYIYVSPIRGERSASSIDVLVLLPDNGFIYSFIHSFIHLVVYLTTGPKPVPRLALHIVLSRASSFRCEYPLISLRSFSRFLLFLHRLPSITSFIFPSITCRRRQFQRSTWPIQLAFRLLIPCRIFL
jgi:hypothetical protein